MYISDDILMCISKIIETCINNSKSPKNNLEDSQSISLVFQGVMLACQLKFRHYKNNVKCKL